MPGEQTPMKALLVEDDASLREGMAELVSELTPVREAASMTEALQALAEERFSLVLTDLRIGDTGGGGRIILEAARQRLQPVVIVSASSAEEVLRLLKPHAPDAALIKPFQLEDMMQLVERFVRLRRDVERLAAGSVPPEEAWTEAGKTPGAWLAPRPDGALWLRLAPGTALSPSLPLPVKRGCAGFGALVREGALEVEGETRGPGQYFYLSAGPRELRAPGGGLAVLVPLGE